MEERDDIRHIMSPDGLDDIIAYLLNTVRVREMGTLGAKRPIEKSSDHEVFVANFSSSDSTIRNAAIQRIYDDHKPGTWMTAEDFAAMKAVMDYVVQITGFLPAEEPPGITIFGTGYNKVKAKLIDVYGEGGLFYHAELKTRVDKYFRDNPAATSIPKTTLEGYTQEVLALFSAQRFSARIKESALPDTSIPEVKKVVKALSGLSEVDLKKALNALTAEGAY